MKTLPEWQKEFGEAARKRFPNNEHWSQQDRLLSILRQLADVGGAIQREQGLFLSKEHGHEDPNHRIASLLADILILCDERGLDPDFELGKVLGWFRGEGPVEKLIQRANEFSVVLEHLLIGKQHVIKTDRDELCLSLWSIVFEHHQGILLLLKTKHYAPAFALMRPITEAFLRLVVVVHGTDSQVAAIRNGSYKTEFATEAKLFDEAFGMQLLGSFFTKDHMNVLHGFTHGGLEQLLRRKDGADIIANYPDNEIRELIKFTTVFPPLTALAVTQFLGYQSEYDAAWRMFTNYLESSR